MKSVQVRAGRRHYQVLIGAGVLARLGALVRQFSRGDHCAVLTDANVAALFGERVCASLREAQFRPELITIAPGEGSKSLVQAGAICEQLSAAGLDRSSFLVALGGGMMGDLAGFVGAIFMRGIPFVSLPTTLLAQIDSCIGGKTGVNSSDGKNLIGAFHHPSLVLADVDVLRTLPERIWNEGFAEAIKHGVIRDPGLFEMAAKPGSFQPDDEATWKLALPDFVERNLAIKAAIVAADEREQTDLRALLNFGHTIGHAIEHAAAGRLLHGEALSLGLIGAAAVSVRRAGLSLGEAEKIRQALTAHRLPTALPPDLPKEKIFDALARDKKFENGRIRFVVAHEIGRATVSREVTFEDIDQALREL